MVKLTEQHERNHAAPPQLGATRMDLEHRFKTEYMDMRKSFLRPLVEQIGSPPRIERIEPILWQGFRDESQKVVEKNAQNIYLSSAAALGVGATVLGIAAIGFGASIATGTADVALAGLIRALSRRTAGRKGRAERELTAALVKLRELRRKLKDLIAAGVTEVPQRIATEIQRLQRRIDRLSQFPDMKDRVQREIDERPSDEPDEVTGTMQEILDKAEPTESVAGDVLSELDSRNAEGDVETITTESQQAGAEQAAITLGARSAFDLWTIHPEESASGTCPICMPWSEKPRSEWSLVYPNGPPIHRFCKCSITFEQLGRMPFDADDNEALALGSFGSFG